MPSKNDLSALKPAPKPKILPSNDGVGTKTETGPLTGKSRAGRKPSPDKRNYKVTLSLTQSEGAKLAAKAGLAGEATVIYAHLKETGFFD